MAPIANGRVTFRATDAADRPIPVTVAGGKQALNEDVSRTITGGAMDGGALYIPHPSTSSPKNFRLRITMWDFTTNKQTVYRNVAVADDGTGIWNFANWLSGQNGDVPLPSYSGTIAIGSVATLAYGTPASVTNRGTAYAAVLDFAIPRGGPGDPGSATVALKANPGTVIVADGDSTVAGFLMPSPASQAWPNVLPALSFFNGCPVHNQAVSGSTLAQMAARYSSGVYPYRPNGTTITKAYLFVLIGRNDIGFNPSGTGYNDQAADAEMSAVNAYIQQAQTDGFTVVQCTVLPSSIESTPPSWYTAGAWHPIPYLFQLEVERYNRLIRMTSKADIVVDMAELMVDPSDQLTTYDGTHETPAFARLMALAAQSAVQNYSRVLASQPLDNKFNPRFGGSVVAGAALFATGDNSVRPGVPYVTLRIAGGKAILEAGDGNGNLYPLDFNVGSCLLPSSRGSATATGSSPNPTVPYARLNVAPGSGGTQHGVLEVGDGTGNTGDLVLNIKSFALAADVPFQVGNSIKIGDSNLKKEPGHGFVPSSRWDADNGFSVIASDDPTKRMTLSVTAAGVMTWTQGAV